MKKLVIISMKKKQLLNRVAALLLSFGSCAYQGMAQNSLSEKLNHVLETQDMESGLKLYHEITDSDIKQLPDSTLLDYHYLGGYLNKEIPNHKKAIFHLLEAKRLCDTSLGTHSGVYMEIMLGLGDEYIELGQYEDALGIFQEGITKSMYMREVASRDFVNLIMGVQKCYELTGEFNEIPTHLLDAWSFWNKDEKPLVTYTYYPLWSLEQYYKKYGMYDEAISVSDKIESFIKSKGGDKHPELSEALYMKGNILVEMNRINEGITAYQEALSILRYNQKDRSELYEMLSSNLLMALISANKIKECDDILGNIKLYSIRSNKPVLYKKSLFSATNKFTDIGNYSRAISYNEELLKQDLTDKERATIEKLKNTILYNQKIVGNLSHLEKEFESLQIGSSNWFEVGHKISSAYYLAKALDKNANILYKMYNTIDIKKSIGTDYYLWVLNNLIGLSFDRAAYKEALKYSAERWNFLSMFTDVPKDYLFNSLNDLIVAKMRTNELDGIDSYLEEIENFYRAQYGEVSNKYAIYLHNRGRTYQLQNKFEEAKYTLLKSITIQNKVKGKPFGDTVKYYMEVEQKLGEL